MWTTGLEPDPAKRLARVSALSALLAATIACAAVAAMPATPARCACLLLTSGVAPLLALRGRYSVTELLAFVPLASIVMWSLLAVIGGRLPTVVLALAPVALAAVLAGLEVKRRRTIEVSLGALDGAALSVAALVALPVRAVFAHNGAVASALPSFQARAWYARDTLYFASLAEMHVATGATPHENPLVAGAPNLYPSLLHCGIGLLSRLGGVRVPFALDVIAPILLIASVAAIPLVVVRAVDDANRARGALVAGALTLAFVMLRVDLFVYPHTQSLVLGWLVLGLAFLVPATHSRGTTLVGALILAALPFAHTVTGTVAMILVAACGLAALRERATRLLGVAFLVGAVAIVLVASRVYALPFPSERLPSFPPGVRAMLEPVLAPWRAVVVAILLLCAASLRSPSRVAAPLLTLALGAAYYAYGAKLVSGGDRWFVHYNAERFIHYAFFASFLAPALRRPVVAGAAIALVAAGLYASPPVVTQASLSLVQASALMQLPAELQLFDAIRARTPPRARIISELGDYALPAFTGRAQATVEAGTLWSMGTLPAGQVEALAGERTQFFGAAPAERLRIARLRGYTHAVVATHLAADARAAYAAQFLPDGAARLVYASPEYLLLELGR